MNRCSSRDLDSRTDIADDTTPTIGVVELVSAASGSSLNDLCPLDDFIDPTHSMPAFGNRVFVIQSYGFEIDVSAGGGVTSYERGVSGHSNWR